MKQRVKFLSLIAILILTAGSLISACSAETPADRIEEENLTESTKTSLNNQDVKEASPSVNPAEEQADLSEAENDEDNTDEVISSSGLSNAEINHLLFMREEEKLAHDVYLALYDQWGLPLFENIAQSEAAHTEAVKGLLDKYGLPDPADASPPGVFVNQDLQGMYDDLTEQGNSSLSKALKVGAAIEEIDILDLQSALDETNTADIKRVYENLLKGSENHLRAFTSTLSRQTGETYAPQYLTQDAYAAIVAGGNARGGGYGGGNGRRP